jgi:hypothetical protein
MALVRTQLFNPADLENVKKIQQQYELKPLSAFLNQPAPAAAPEVPFIKPLTPDQQKKDLQFFSVLNFALNYCPTHPSETQLRERFAKIGIGAGQPLDVSTLSPEVKAAMEQGIADAWVEFQGLQKDVDAGKVASGDLFGTRDYLKNNYLFRMAGAIIGIYGNSKQEAMYPIFRADADGQPLNGANKYTVRFEPGKLPPVNAFWSLTMYEMPASLLVDNPINRYLINSPMLPNLKKDADGGITLYIQHTSPGKAKESNWLPSPAGPFVMVLRLYLPGEEAMNGTWKAPQAVKVK